MPQDLAKYAADRGVRYFLISFVDLFGVLRAKLVPAAAIALMQRDGAAFAGFATHLDPLDARAWARHPVHTQLPICRIDADNSELR